MASARKYQEWRKKMHANVEAAKTKLNTIDNIDEAPGAPKLDILAEPVPKVTEIFKARKAATTAGTGT